MCASSRVGVDKGVGVGMGVCEFWRIGPRWGDRETQCCPSLETLEDIPGPLGLALPPLEKEPLSSDPAVGLPAL